MSKCSGKNKTRGKTRWQFSAGIGGNFQPEWPATFSGLGGRFAAEYTLLRAEEVIVKKFKK